MYAFDSATETDITEAVAKGTLASMGQDQSGNSAERSWIRQFNLADLGLENDTYYIRVRAVPGQEVPVAGVTPATIWGGPSQLSGPITHIAPARYNITYGATANGAVTGPASTYAGLTVTLKATPAAGCVLVDGSVKINGVAATATSLDTFTFVMPAENVTVTAEFAKILETPAVTYNFDYRSLIYTPDDDAQSYNLWVFNDPVLAAASTDGTGAVAVATGVTSTDHSKSFGGTTAIRPPVTEGRLLLDVRLLTFDNVGTNDVTRDLPAGFLPGGIADSYFAGGCDGSCEGVPHEMAGPTEQFANRPWPHREDSPCLVSAFEPGDTTNLRPGQYWFRLQAIAGTGSGFADSALNALPAPPTMGGAASAPPNPFSIAMGPTEAKEFIEENLAVIADKDNKEIRFVDIRGVTTGEIGEEGHIRYSERALPTEIGNDGTLTAAANKEKAEAFFGYVDNKDEVTILLY